MLLTADRKPKIPIEQIRKVPGAEVQSINVQTCNNPTFSPDGRNLLAENAPFPSECDKVGVSQCSQGSGGAKDQETPVTGEATGGVDSGGTGTMRVRRSVAHTPAPTIASMPATASHVTASSNSSTP